MTATIVVLSDTHVRDWEEVHPEIRRAVSGADIAIHCGDFTGADVVDGFRRDAKESVVVHGNSDPPEIRRAIPYVEVLQLEGMRIGVTHPAWGGPPFELGELLGDFAEPVDAIVFGHVHEPTDCVHEGVRFVNPGQGYSSFMVPATIAVLTVEDGAMSVEIREIEAGR